MTVVRRRLDPANPPNLRIETHERLAAISAAEIERNALSDPDNPPLTEDELARVSAIRAIKRARERAGLTQAGFAERYHVKLTRLRDWEQGRFQPDSFALGFLKVIAEAPEMVARVLSAHQIEDE